MLPIHNLSSRHLPTMPLHEISVTQALYAPIFDSSQGYTTQTERNNLTIADITIVRNTRVLNQASFHPIPYAYEFSLPPALHGVHPSYTFYDVGTALGVNNTTVAGIMQGSPHAVCRDRPAECSSLWTSKEFWVLSLFVSAPRRDILISNVSRISDSTQQYGNLNRTTAVEHSNLCNGWSHSYFSESDLGTT